MATIKQKTLFQKLLENVSNGNPKSLAVLAQESGYRKIAYQSGRIIEAKGFQELLRKIDDEIILAKVYEVLLSEDKRSSLAAADILLKLKNRYPAGESKFIGLFGNLDSLK